MNQVVIKDFWTSKSVFGRLLRSDVKGSLVAHKLFSEPIKCLLVVDEAHVAFSKYNANKKR